MKEKINHQKKLMSDSLMGHMIGFDDLADYQLVPELMAAALMGVSPRTLSTWAICGMSKLPSVRVGSCRKYRVGDIRNHLNSNTFHHATE